MKTMPTILILTLTACSNSVDKQTNGRLQDTNPQGTNTIIKETKDTLRTNGDREYIDSANFHIIRGKYISGAKFIDVYENKLTKLDNWKAYYENGKLKEEGIMTNANHIYLGVWKYYSNAGEIDSIIDYDKKYTISYFTALKIAEKKGFKMPDMEVTLKVDSVNTFWQVAKWTENNNYSGQTADAILIDTKTGTVTKPDYQPLSIY